MDLQAIRERYLSVRAFSEALCEPLQAEDMVVQTMPDVSPTKWHLAHTTWFFETFILAPLTDYRPHHPAYAVLFNSYYQGVGPQHPRTERGLLSRPTVDEVRAYREAVDRAVLSLLDAAPSARTLEILSIGLHHEEQHQELLLTDIKHVLGTHPLWPGYREAEAGQPSGASAPALAWVPFAGGLVEIGHEGQTFAYDNEGPRHPVFLPPFELGDRLVTCGEYLEFIEAGGYRDPGPWLSDGWNAVQSRGWEAPLYWRRQESGFHLYTLGGARPIDPAEPVTHLSYFEADAYARFVGARLPTEFEWEHAAVGQPIEGVFARGGRLHPAPAAEGPGLKQLFGDGWEWTRSAYLPYPGYRAVDGALGEYNGKFMVSQQVLRGGSCATPSAEHLRPTYRNFFPPDARWQFSALRLAREPTP